MEQFIAVSQHTQRTRMAPISEMGHKRSQKLNGFPHRGLKRGTLQAVQQFRRGGGGEYSMRRGALGGTGPVRQVRGSGRGGSDGIEEEAVRLRT